LLSGNLTAGIWRSLNQDEMEGGAAHMAQHSRPTSSQPLGALNQLDGHRHVGLGCIDADGDCALVKGGVLGLGDLADLRIEVRAELVRFQLSRGFLEFLALGLGHGL